MEKLNVSVDGCGCESCSLPAVVAVRGETDSFGYETIYLCDACHKQMEGNVRDYHQALDVEDVQAPAGMQYMVAESYNHDDGGTGFFLVTSSMRKAVAYYRRSGDQAARRCGLYPNKGVRTVTQEEADKAAAGQRAAERELIALSHSWDDEMQEKEEEHDFDHDYSDYTAEELEAEGVVFM